MYNVLPEHRSTSVRRDTRPMEASSWSVDRQMIVDGMENIAYEQNENKRHDPED